MKKTILLITGIKIEADENNIHPNYSAGIIRIDEGRINYADKRKKSEFHSKIEIPVSSILFIFESQDQDEA